MAAHMAMALLCTLRQWIKSCAYNWSHCIFLSCQPCCSQCVGCYVCSIRVDRRRSNTTGTTMPSH